MTTKRVIVYALLALAVAFLAHKLWYTDFNPLIWDLTYIGTRLAWAVHQPDYDSVASARTFDALAILINALIYFVILVAGDRSRARLRKRASRNTRTAKKAN